MPCATKLMAQPGSKRPAKVTRRPGKHERGTAVTCSLCACTSHVRDLDKLRKYTGAAECSDEATLTTRMFSTAREWNSSYTHYCETCGCGCVAASPEHAHHVVASADRMAVTSREALDGQMNVLEQKRQTLLEHIAKLASKTEIVDAREKVTVVFPLTSARSYTRSRSCKRSGRAASRSFEHFLTKKSARLLHPSRALQLPNERRSRYCLVCILVWV
jgi:hypothetical protein